MTSSASSRPKEGGVLLTASRSRGGMTRGTEREGQERTNTMEKRTGHPYNDQIMATSNFQREAT